MAGIYSPDGSFVVSGGADGTVVVWDAANGAAEMTLQGVSIADPPVLSVAVSPGDVAPYGYLIAVSNGNTEAAIVRRRHIFVRQRRARPVDSGGDVWKHSAPRARTCVPRM